VQIRLACTPGQLRITVSDNGQGARGESGAGADGLENMRQRLERMNGQCRITSSAAGTIVEFTLPLPPTTDEAEPALPGTPH
jgi:signal transduction histidine kinase